MTSIQCLRQISNYLKVPLNKISEDEEKLPTCNLQNTTITGFINIIETLVKQSQIPSLLGSNLIERAEIRQWLQFCMSYGQYCNKRILLEDLNMVLAKKTYFVGSDLTIADITMFYIVQNIIEKMSYLEKEKYLNVSRWYDNIQQNEAIRRDKPLIDFSTIFLSCLTV